MPRIVDFERQFFRTTNDLEKKEKVRQKFIKRINALSEDWINDKLRWDIARPKE